MDGWSRVIYQTNLQTWTGYTYAGYVEEWIEPACHDVLKIRNATPNASDFAQNLIYLGNVQFNLCGEFSVLYCVEWEEFDVEAWLDEWKIKDVPTFKRIFKLGRSQPVGVSDLVRMFQSFEGYGAFMNLTDMFRYRGTALFTPGRTAEALKTHQLIAGCKIGAQFGRLQASGIPHWVVIDSIQPEGRGGLVKLYNPASNSVETYTWEQVVESCSRNPYGLAVAR